MCKTVLGGALLVTEPWRNRRFCSAAPSSCARVNTGGLRLTGAGVAGRATGCVATGATRGVTVCLRGVFGVMGGLTAEDVATGAGFGGWEGAREAVRLRPGDPVSHALLGRTLAAQRAFDEAIAELRVALQLDPSDAEARDDLARIARLKGR